MKKYIIVFLVILSLILIMAGYKETGEEHKKYELNTKGAKYVVSLSRQLEHNAKLLFIDETGKEMDSFKYKGYGIFELAFFDSNYYMYSMRLNQHYKLENNGKFDSFSLQKEKYNDIAMASWFVSKGKEFLIESMNIGPGENGYLSSVVYRKNGIIKEAVFNNRLLADALEYKDKIFVKCTADAGNLESGISVINMDTNKITDMKVFDDDCIASGREKMVQYKNKIILYGYMDGMSGLGTFDMDTYDIDSFLMEDDEYIAFVYTYDDLLYVVTNKNILYKYDEHLNLVGKEIIKNEYFSSAIGNKKLYISKIINQEDVIHVVYASINFSEIENMGYIEVYNKKNMATVSRTPIINKGAKIWMGEHVDVVLYE